MWSLALFPHTRTVFVPSHSHCFWRATKGNSRFRFVSRFLPFCGRAIHSYSSPEANHTSLTPFVFAARGAGYPLLSLTRGWC